MGKALWKAGGKQQTGLEGDPTSTLTRAAGYINKNETNTGKRYGHSIVI